MIFVLPLESCTAGKAIKHGTSDVDQIVYFHFRIEKILYVHVHQSSSGSEDDSFFLLYPHTEKQLYIGIVFYSYSLQLSRNLPGRLYIPQQTSFFINRLNTTTLQFSKFAAN